MNLFNAAILGIVQGLTEFIPVSSTGHLILIRELLGIQDAIGLSFDAVLQLATILAVLVYFGKKLKDLTKKDYIALLIGTIPAAILGFLLEDTMENAFRSPVLVAGALIAGSILMYVADKKSGNSSEITPKKGFWIGCFQALALIPGISRSGATISGGLIVGLTREKAVLWSFLLSVPIIAGSGFKKALDLYSSGMISSLAPELIIGGFAAFISGLIAIRFLIRYIQNHGFTVFVWYRVVLAVVVLAVALI